MHKIGEEHSRCMVKFYNLYLEKNVVCIEAILILSNSSRTAAAHLRMKRGQLV